MRILLLGHGRMGRLVESLAPEYGGTIAGVIDERSGERAIAEGQFGDLDVAIDFTLADAVPRNLPQLAARRINVVIGTTGWQSQESAMRVIAKDAGIGVLAASNFSLGMNVFQLAVEEAGRHFAKHPEFGAWIHEAHHVMKKDAPSGTALTIKSGMEHAGYQRPIDMSSTRAGSIPGTHAVGFDGPSETIEFTHTVRDRAVFARGALTAAKWLVGKRGWFSIRDIWVEVLRTFYVRSTDVLRSRIAMRTMFTGVGTALVTPFTKSGALDEAAIKRLARRQIDSGIHFLVPCGTTGETPTLSPAERRRVVELVLEAAAGEVPVMAGAGGYDTQEVVHVAQEMQRIGVQGLLSVTPYYNKPTPEGLYAHFSKIAEATPLPIMLYNVPGRTGCNIDAADVREARHHPARDRRQGSVGQHHADGRDLPRGAAGISRLVG